MHVEITGKVFANTVGICNKVKILKQTRYSGFLPNVSESGTGINGPTPSMTTKPVWYPITPSVVVWRDSAICSMPGANIELARGLRTGYPVRRSGMERERDGGSN